MFDIRKFFQSRYLEQKNHFDVLFEHNATTTKTSKLTKIKTIIQAKLTKTPEFLDQKDLYRLKNRE